MSEYVNVIGHLNQCGERGPVGPQGPIGPQGPQGEAGPAGPSDLSNFNQTPINLTSNGVYDPDEGTTISHIKLQTTNPEIEGSSAIIKMENEVVKLSSDDESTPGSASLELSPGSVKATTKGWPGYQETSVQFTPGEFTARLIEEDPMMGDLYNHKFTAEGSYLTHAKNDEDATAVNQIESTVEPPTDFESYYPEANIPVGAVWHNTTKDTLSILTKKKVVEDPDLGEIVKMNWQTIPTKEVLWENPDKNAVFYGQDISIPTLQNYRWVMFEFGRAAGSAYAVQATTILPTEYTVGGAFMINTTSTKVQFLTRNIGKTNATTIHIYASMMNAVTVATGTWDSTQTDIQAMIPLRIIGIK